MHHHLDRNTIDRPHIRHASKHTSCPITTGVFSTLDTGLSEHAPRARHIMAKFGAISLRASRSRAPCDILGSLCCGESVSQDQAGQRRASQRSAQDGRYRDWTQMDHRNTSGDHIKPQRTFVRHACATPIKKWRAMQAGTPTPGLTCQTSETQDTHIPKKNLQRSRWRSSSHHAARFTVSCRVALGHRIPSHSHPWCI